MLNKASIRNFNSLQRLKVTQEFACDALVISVLVAQLHWDLG